MTAMVQPNRRPRSWLQPIFLWGALGMLAPIVLALAAALLRGQPLPWQFHRPWVSPHLAAALLALGLGALQLGLPKGDRRHRLMGYAWCVLMAAIGVSGLMIQLMPGQVTLVHRLSSLFAAADLILLPMLIWAARTGRPRLHRGAALGLFACMLNAGALAFIPQRAVGALVLGLFH